MLQHAVLGVWIVALLALAASVIQPTPKNASDSAAGEKRPPFRAWAIRYQVKDVERSVAFYTKHLDFKLEQQSGSAFAKVSNGHLALLLSGPKASGSRPMPDGRKQEPGGWNRYRSASANVAPTGL